MAEPKSAGTIERAEAAAARLFATQGYAETSTRELSNAIGVTNGTFYHYFSSKEQLLLRICEDSLAVMDREVRASIDQADDSLEALAALIRCHVRVLTESVDANTTMLKELKSLTGKGHARVVTARDAYDQLVEATIESAQKAGYLRQDMPAGVMRLLLLNLLNWTIFWFTPDGPLSPEELGGYAVELFLNGAKSA